MTTNKKDFDYPRSSSFASSSTASFHALDIRLSLVRSLARFYLFPFTGTELSWAAAAAPIGQVLISHEWDGHSLDTP